MAPTGGETIAYSFASTPFLLGLPYLFLVFVYLNWEEEDFLRVVNDKVAIIVVVHAYFSMTCVSKLLASYV